MALVGSVKNAEAQSNAINKAASGLSLPPLRRTSTNVEGKATILVYSQARWGKTRLARTIKGSCLILAGEIGARKGLGTLQDCDIPYIVFENEKHLGLILGELNKRADGVVEYMGDRFDWVFMDSLSAAGEMWYDAAKDALKVPPGDMASIAGVDGRQLYGYVAERGRQQFKMLLNLNAHLCVVAREGVQEEGTGQAKIQFVAPEIPGQKLPRELPGWPDATLHGVIHNGKRLMRTKTVAKAVAGIRLPDRMKDQNITVPELILPDLEALKDLMLGDPSAIARLTPGKDEAAKAPSR